MANPADEVTEVYDAVRLFELIPRAQALSVSDRLFTTLRRDGVLLAASGILLNSCGPTEEAKVLGRVLAHLAVLKLRQLLHEKELDFWRERSKSALDDLERERASAFSQLQLQERIAESVREISRLPKSKRFSGLASAAAALGGFESWLLAVKTGEGFEIRANATGTTIKKLEASSALVTSFERKAVIIRSAFTEAEGSDERLSYPEDKLLKRSRLNSYVVIPFSSGAVLLASSFQHSGQHWRNARTFLEIAGPIVDGWLKEEELERYRALVTNLGKRIIREAESERLRIARDLHDDQAQLLATLKVILDVPRKKAERLLSELEDELRKRISLLRPKLLDGQSLNNAIRNELARLKTAGVRVRFSSDFPERGVSKDILQILFYAFREGLANALRHGVRNTLTVRLQREPKLARLDIRNDVSEDKPKKRQSYESAGLKGLQERLSSFGGRCCFVLKNGRCHLSVEIPLLRR